MLNLKVYDVPEKSTWCPRCGDFGILAAIKQALAILDLAPHQIHLFSGIGCGSKLPHYMNAYAYNTIHGRSLPVGTGFRLVNQDMPVICVTGDGDGYGIGGNHFIHTARRNPNIVHLVENNQVYGLTKGQYSPTSDSGYVTTTSPEGSIEFALNPIAVAMAAGATFVARSFSSDPKHLAWVISEAIKHKGYALVDILQPCITFNKINTKEWYQSRVYKVQDEAGYDFTNREKAWAKAQEWGDKIPTGILWKHERETYEEQVPVISKGVSPYRRDISTQSIQAEWDKVKAMFC